MVTFTRIRVSSMLLSAVLGVGDDVALRTADEARCHHADMYRILTVGSSRRSSARECRAVGHPAWHSPGRGVRL